MNFENTREFSKFNYICENAKIFFTFNRNSLIVVQNAIVCNKIYTFYMDCLSMYITSTAWIISQISNMDFNYTK